MKDQLRRFAEADSQLGFEGSMSLLNCLAEPLVLEGARVASNK